MNWGAAPIRVEYDFKLREDFHKEFNHKIKISSMKKDNIKSAMKIKGNGDSNKKGS